MGQDVVLTGRNELPKDGINIAYSKASVTSVGHVKTDAQPVDENGESLTVDTITRSLTTIDYEHHEIHSGSHYFMTGFTQVDDADEIVFGVTTLNSNTWAHATTLINGTSQIEILIYEDSTFTGGTPVESFNNNRNSTNTSVVQLVGAPTVTDVGTLLSSQSYGKAGVNPQASKGGLPLRTNEVILKANTKYIFKTISRDDANIISYRADWYEHTNKV